MIERNLYRLLDIAETATPHEIRQAYELARRTYGGDSLATYSLFGAEDRQAVMTQIEEAYRVLSDPERRRAYDRMISTTEPPAGSANGVDGMHAADAGATELMNDAASTPEEIPIPDVVTGGDLKRFRESRRMSLDMIANLTRINIKYLQYLEEDQHGKLPHTVFIRSYLSQYAKVLKLDPDRVLNGYLNGMAKSPSNP
jgi:DnaJ-class molecular chaperone